MKRAVILFGLAALLFIAYGLASAAGWAEHTSVIAGMPLSESSRTIGPAFIALRLAIVVIAPIFTIAAAIDVAIVLMHRMRRNAFTSPTP